MMGKGEKITIYRRLMISLVAALIGTFVVPIIILLFQGSLDFEQIKMYAPIGAVLFALLGFVFPRLMVKVLFVLTLFQ
jgi:hypothetical protein